MLRRFFIENLNNHKNINIPFDSNVKIIVASNGAGKTTVLNLIFSLISGDYRYLNKISFDKIGFEFTDGQVISFSKSEFSNNMDSIMKIPSFAQMANVIDANDMLRLIALSNSIPKQIFEELALFKEAAKKLEIPEYIFSDYIKSFRSKANKKVAADTKDKIDRIRNLLPYELLYLPTYRRIEEKLDILKNELSLPGLNFGMDDVRQNIKRITDEISTSTNKWFSIVNAKMLTQMVDGAINITEKMKKQVLEPLTTEIVLSRVGSNMTKENKDSIIQSIKSREILEDDKKFLLYFVANLVEVYEQQIDNDNALKNFTNTCNGYLIDKKLEYNENELVISIKPLNHKADLTFDNLSSGEKQIVSLFSMLYLQKKKNIAVLFDEPEISLSIEWQRKILSDIVHASNCKLLIAATHSPFIFDNELSQHASDLELHSEIVND